MAISRWKTPKTSKYGAKRCVSSDGISFPSLLEKSIYENLKRYALSEDMLLIRQVSFDLPAGYRHVVDFMPEYRDWETDRKSTRLNSSHSAKSRMPSSA